MLQYWVIGQVSHGAGYGLGILVCFVFQGHVKGVEEIKNEADEAERKVRLLSKRSGV